MFVAMQEGYCQNNPLAPEDSALIVHLTDDLAFYKGEVRKLLLLRQDTTLLNAALRDMSLLIDQHTKGASEDNAHVSILQLENERQRREIAKRQEVEDQQDKVIKRLGSPKRWSIGPVVSYGLSGTATLGISDGFGIMYRLFSL